MRTPWTACFLLCCCAISSVAKEDAVEGDVIWSFPADGNVMATAVLDHRHVYFGSFSESASETQSKLYCVDQEQGNEIWSHTLPNWMQAAPVITETRLLVGCNDTKLYCLNKFTGDELWHFDTAGKVDSTPCVDLQGNVYVGSRDQFFYALNANGELLWSDFLTGPIASSPILDELLGRIYIADLANTIYAYTLEGEQLWAYKPRQGSIEGVRLRIYSSPALDDEQFLYVGSGDHHLYAINKETGTLFWRIDTGAIVDSSPVISMDDFLYVANRDGILFKFLIEPFATDRHVWQSDEIGQVFYGSPTIDANQNIYICGASVLESSEETPKTQLSYIDHETGHNLWTTMLDGYTDATPVLDTEGNVYIGTAANQLHKIRGAGHTLADTSWPTFHGTASGHGRYEQTFSRWLISFGIPVEFANEERDSDNDGSLDFEEFVFGTNPQEETSFPNRFPTYGIDNEGLPQLTYQVQKALRAPFSVDASTDLLGWTPLLLSPNEHQFTDQVLSWQITTALPPAINGAHRFFRVHWQR